MIRIGSLDFWRKAKKLYGYGGALDGFEMKQETPSYSIGIGKTKLERKNTELSYLESEEKKISEAEAMIEQQKEGQDVGE